MAFDKDAFLSALDGMSVMELNDLVKAIEEKFGVSAASMAAPAAGGGGGGGAAAVEEKTEYNVMLLEAGANKVSGIENESVLSMKNSSSLPGATLALPPVQRSMLSIRKSNAVIVLMLASSIPGNSIIRNAAPIRRAHPRFVENLCALGADIDWRDSQ